MTNGEKIQQIFSNAEIGYGLRGVVAVTFIHKTIFDLDWWNAEYKEPTTKNDLGVDAVSRKAVINQIFYSTDNNGDVVLGSALRERIARLPSVTPQESKTEHWIKVDTNRYTCGCCYTSFTVDLDDNNITQFNYCPNCGAKMVEPQESEDKE